jgi:hypothetical protein
MAGARLGDPWRSREEASLLLRAVLWIVARLRGPLVAFGVDYGVFRELLRTRILMDLRPSSGGQGLGVAGIALSILMTWLAGLGTGIFALLPETAPQWPLIAQTALLCLLLFYLLQALVGLLVDPSDVRVLIPHPVPDRTLFAVRLMQVFAYLALLAVGFTAGSVFLAVFGQPVLPTLLVFPLLSLLTTLTALGAVSLFFAALLRIVGPASFQRVSLWTQVISAVLFMAVTQGGGRLLPEAAVKELWAWGQAHPSWKLLWPPAQCARAFALAAGDWSHANLLGLSCALATPALALFVTLRLASRSYVAALEGTLELGRRSGVRWPGRRSGWLLGRLVHSRAQRAGLDFTLALSRREAHVLRGALPQLVSFQVMALALGTRHLGKGGVGYFVCFSAGMVALVLPTLLELCQGTPAPQARWLFQVVPLEDEAELLRGGIKGLVLSWYAPTLAVVGLLQLLIAGAGELPRIVLALELSVIVALLYVRNFSLGVPFTRDIKKSEGLSNLGLILTMFFAVGILFAIHWALSLHPLLLATGVLGCALVIVLLWRGLDSMRVATQRTLLSRSEERAS